jgi:hypothetical protein
MRRSIASTCSELSSIQEDHAGLVETDGTPRPAMSLATQRSAQVHTHARTHARPRSLALTPRNVKEMAQTLPLPDERPDISLELSSRDRLRHLKGRQVRARVGMICGGFAF